MIEGDNISPMLLSLFVFTVMKCLCGLIIVLVG